MSEPVRIGDATLYTGDVLEVLRSMPSESVHCVVSSPPYWGLRDYGIEPSVWDGEPGCAHEWGASGRKGGGAHTGRDLLGHGEETQEQRQAISSASTGSFCSLCGAWRGAHGLEPTPELYVQHEVLIWREARRVLRADGTAWINIGDSYAGSGRGPSKSLNKNNSHSHQAVLAMGARMGSKHGDEGHTSGQTPPHGYKAKDLVGIPEQLALALRADGWYWRSRIPWIKRNCMPESCRDRPATAVEYVMMFSKSNRYYYDRQAVKMQSAGTAHARGDGVNPKAKVPAGWDQENHGRNGNGRFRPKQNESFSGAVVKVVKERNRRNSDWFMESWQGLLTDEDGEPIAFVVNTRGFKDAHFATFPPKLVRPMILAGCPEHVCPKCGAPWVKEIEKSGGTTGHSWHDHSDDLGRGQQKNEDGMDTYRVQVIGEHPTCTCGLPSIGGTVLDPFGGSGTTAAVALEYGRKAILIELKPEYVEMQKKRIRPVAGRPMLAFGGTE